MHTSVEGNSHIKGAFEVSIVGRDLGLEVGDEANMWPWVAVKGRETGDVRLGWCEEEAEWAGPGGRKESKNKKERG